MIPAYEIDGLRGEAVRYIQRWIGTPYKYGGDDFSGFDCSGLIIEVLQSVGRIAINEDKCAHDLYLKLKYGSPEEKPHYGYLVFWFRDGRAYHVAMLINEFQVCEAAGGDENTESREDAIRDNAYVRVRPVDYRGKGYKIVDPFKNWEPEWLKAAYE